MKTLGPEVILLVNIVHVAGTCADGDDHIYSANEVVSQRCSDDKFFYYTSRYENESYCMDSEIKDEGYCWWDTTVESHCLKSEECVWLDDNIVGGVCYCAATDHCESEVCDQTPSPTYSMSSFVCPDDCKVYYVGCASMYCNCFGECASAEEFGCINPVNPHCHIWYTHRPTDVPTRSPTSAKSVYWGCKLCCFGESKISITTNSVAQALGLKDVRIKSYNQVGSGSRRVTEVDQQWEIVYELGLEEGMSPEDLLASLNNSEVLNFIAQYISRDLEIELETIETTMRSEDDPTAARTSDSVAAMVGGIIGALVAVVFVIFLAYKIYIYREMKRFEIDTQRMTAEGLSPIDVEDAAYSL